MHRQSRAISHKPESPTPDPAPLRVRISLRRAAEHRQEAGRITAAGRAIAMRWSQDQRGTVETEKSGPLAPVFVSAAIGPDQALTVLRLHFRHGRKVVVEIFHSCRAVSRAE